MAASSIGGFSIGQSPIGGAGGDNPARPSSTTRSWRQIVLDADPDWQRMSLRPWVYEFSNSRRFYDPANPYEGLISGDFILDESELDDGAELA